MSAFSPLTTWLESSSASMLWGEIHGGGLGDGGRSCGWDWIFGPILNDAEVHLSVRASAEPLRTGQLGTGTTSISVQAQGTLRYESAGHFPLVSWLEQEGASRIFPVSQGGGLGDGGFHSWTDWVFGNPVSMEGTTDVQVTASATLHLGIGDADAPVTMRLDGDLLVGYSSAIWDTEYRHATVSLSDNYLSATAPKETYRGVRGKKSHTSGKYYFEFTRKTVPDSESMIVGMAKSTADTRTEVWQPDTWFWIANFLYEDGATQTIWDQSINNGVNAIAVDLDAGKIWFYSGTGAVWHNSGNPAAGTNPTFTGVLGTLYPIFNSGFGSTYPSAVTANFGATAFTHSVPSGFESWNATEPLIGDGLVEIAASGSLTISRTLLGLAGSDVSMALSGTLTNTSSLIFSGNLAIGLETEGVLTVPRTLLGTADADIALDADGTLTQQTELVIQATLTVLAQGDLSGTRMMIGNTTISLVMGGALGYEMIHATAALSVPVPILDAEANDYDNIRLAVTVPAPILTAFTGAVVTLPVPEPTLTSTGTVQVFASVALEVPAPELTATASTQVGATVELEVPAPTLTAATGAYASLEVLAPELTATGSVEHLARVALTLPFIELTATAKVGTLALVELEIPSPSLEAAGVVGAVANATLMLPAIILTSIGRVSPGVGIAATALATETTYAINLTTGAVTNLLLGELDRLVTAHGRLYGLRGEELVRLDGDLDGAATIPATIRFAPQSFGSNRTKRANTVYLSSREDDGLTLELIEDESRAWRYQTATDTAPAYGTHKIKVGRGVKFHTAGLAVYNRNGGRMDIGGIEVLVDTHAPRPKS